MRHLFVTQDFPPDLGGMARRHYELARWFPGHEMAVSTVASPGVAARDRAEPFAVDRQPFTFAEAKRFTNQIRWARSLIARAADVDVLHVGNVRPVGYAAWWAARRTGLPYLLYVNGGDILLDRRKARSWIKRVGARRIFGDASGIVANSAYTAALAADYMRELGIAAPPPIAHIDLGTDPEHFDSSRDTGALRRRLGIGVAPMVLTVARLVPHKGQDVALRAVALLAREFPELRYVMVGEGPDDARLRALARELRVGDRAIFAGTLGDDEIAEAYATAEVYLGISRQHEDKYVEGFGISFVEAGASGTPSVAGDSGGVRSAVRDGETGLLVPPEDPAAVAAALRTLLGDPELRARMGRAARAAVESHYNWERVARQTRDFAERVVGSTVHAS